MGLQGVTGQAFGAEAAAAAAAAVARIAGSLMPDPLDPAPHVGVILGSGLGGLVHQVTQAVTVPYSAIPGFPAVGVQGHAGEVVLGTLAGTRAVLFSGRFHVYEGHSLQLAAFPVRVARALGATMLLVSNAAGGVNTSFSPGDLMLITDHLNLMFDSPLSGPCGAGEVRFPDMSAAYDPELLRSFRDAAARLDVPLRQGVYAALRGPAYETPAEVRMLRLLGADAVGMSTVPEVVMARALGMRVAGVSCITNMAAGVQEQPLDHAEVLGVTAGVASRFEALVSAFLETI